MKTKLTKQQKAAWAQAQHYVSLEKTTRSTAFQIPAGYPQWFVIVEGKLHERTFADRSAALSYIGSLT